MTVILVSTVIVFAILVVFLAPKAGKEDQKAVVEAPTETAVPNPTIPPMTTGPEAPAQNDEGVFPADFEDEPDTTTDDPPANPRGEGCVRFSWQAELKAGAGDPVPIEITITNACGFEVDVSDMEFNAQGLLAGEEVNATSGAFPGVLQPGESTLLTLTMPARTEGYDRLQVSLAGAQ